MITFQVKLNLLAGFQREALDRQEASRALSLYEYAVLLFQAGISHLLISRKRTLNLQLSFLPHRMLLLIYQAIFPDLDVLLILYEALKSYVVNHRHYGHSYNDQQVQRISYYLQFHTLLLICHLALLLLIVHFLFDSLCGNEDQHQACNSIL
ncbi:Uncharacterised protein [Streptococcus pneumoniae]|nr:Uncharacterised protein [Streptococcus pneumoniae]